jgi:hypothetical protein
VKKEIRGQCQRWTLNDIPLARCSDASLTHTLRLAVEVEDTRVRGRQRISPFGCADPYPFRLNFMSDLGISMVAFRLGFVSYPFGLPCAVSKALRPHSGLTTLIIYSFPAYPL